MSGLDDGDGGFRSGHIMLDADEMRMRDVRSVIMYSGDVALRLDVQGLRMRGWNGGMLGDVEHMMILWLMISADNSGAGGRYNGKQNNEELHGV